MNEPAIVWADEPTGDLDSETAGEIIALMRQLNRENRQTFVVVTHSQDVGEQADRIVRMRDGQIVDYGTSNSRERSSGSARRPGERPDSPPVTAG